MHDKKELDPKNLMAQRKVPVLGVVPPSSIIAEAVVMRYGAYEAPRVDGTFGYGPFNWRDKPIEAMTYIDAAIRHLTSWVDGENNADDSLLPHLWHAKASIGILIDAIERNKWTDNRPPSGVTSAMISRHRRATTQQSPISSKPTGSSTLSRTCPPKKATSKRR